ncbi:hypothetical protein [Cellulomonas denverensis]|uniref:Uncharacterized protein n=1 Tax=Cellulomonas denverensis TaxID=264297 RepID=A0A7X6R0I2_9CELL|nr:hypothetical protein [Cellulomonas denverensis]NKY24263.1 hypothetical protein [Cellulomonas denverensis]GIG26738.1 hypothetical protein Cde04nite_29820 [Cellulomonas denverensis]
MTGLTLPDRWWRPDDDAALRAELNREIGRGHPLRRRIDRVEARFEASDDLVVRLDDGGYALVHPTWSGHRERAPFPLCRLLGDAGAASAAIAGWEA